MSNQKRDLSQQHDLFSLRETWKVTHCGASYLIEFNMTRGRNVPSWYVIRINDGAKSERFYSWPEGAFSALSWGRIHWEK